MVSPFQNAFFVDVTDIADRKDDTDNWFEYLYNHPGFDPDGQDQPHYAVLLRRRSANIDMSRHESMTDEALYKVISVLMYSIGHEIAKMPIPKEHRLIAKIYPVVEHWDFQICCNVYDVGEV